MMKALAVLVFLFPVFLPVAHAETLIGDVRVVDGDTLEFEGLGITVRLSGIDAPESRQTCEGADGNRYRCGGDVTRALVQRIAAAPVRCEGDERDRYGRLIATCFTPEGLDLNGWMVEQGHALAYRRYSERYVPQEEAAKQARRGVWAGAFVAPWDWRRGERLSGSEGDRTADGGSTEGEAVDALALWDDNGNGRITCKEARRHGIAPVPRDHPAYPYMRDADGDGVVCERSR